MGITETAATTTTGLGAANAVESKQILSLEVFQDIFKHVEPDVQIDAFEVRTLRASTKHSVMKSFPPTYLHIHMYFCSWPRAPTGVTTIRPPFIA